MSPATIKCPKCGESFEPGDAFLHQVSEKLLAAEKIKHEEALKYIREQTEKEVAVKITEESKIRMRQLEKEAGEEKERNKKLIIQLEESLEEMRLLRRKQEEMEFENKKKIAEKESEIREEARKKFQQEHELKDLENEKVKSDLKKKIEELQAKIQQGSQQNQGEVMELAIEEVLKREFPTDVIEEVKKGQRGADILQRVVDKKGKECGIILWESKNAQWSDGWITKLREDQRQAKADLAVLAVETLPKGKENYIYDAGVWVCLRTLVVPLALSLRYGLVRLNFERESNVGKREKMEELYRYINSIEFTHRMEAIIEAFGAMQDEVEREKRWFSTKWARQEKQLRKVLDHTQGMYGDLQGVIGKALPELKEQTVPEMSADVPLLVEDKPF